MDLIDGLSLIAGLQAAIGGVVVVADWLPAALRTPAHREEAVTTSRLPIIGGPGHGHPVQRDVIVDIAERARRTQREGEAHFRRGEALRRQVDFLGTALRDAREQLEAYETATVTAPTTVVLDEQPTGGER